MLERRGQQVRRGVPESMLRLRFVPFVEPDGGAVFDRFLNIPALSVHGRGKGLLRQSRTNRFGDLKRRDACCELTAAAVGECNVDHTCSVCKTPSAPARRGRIDKVSHFSLFRYTEGRKSKLPNGFFIRGVARIKKSVTFVPLSYFSAVCGGCDLSPRW